MTPAVHELTTEYVPVAELRSYYRNPRQGNITAIGRSLTVNGQYKPIVANRGTHTGREHEVLAGNHTLAAARDLGWEHIAVVWVDVDNDQAARIVAADNRTADLGTYDDRLLLEMLSDLPDLDGTGYDPGDYDALVQLLQPDPTESSDKDDQDLLDDTDRQGWPVIRAQVSPEIHQRWGLVDGDNDAAKITTLLDVAGY